MKRALLVSLGGMIAATAAVVASGCSSPNPDVRVNPGALDRAGFAEVAPVLNRRCGSVDCHGTPRRNLRIYGYGGMRAAPTDTPDFPATTPDEIERDFQSIMALEPEAMAKFIAEGRHDPRDLTFYMKPRNAQSHKGGERIVAGDNADLCILTWLTATVHVSSCRAAAAETNPLQAP